MSPNLPSTLVASSPFLDAGAVEAWDAWVRWREHGELRDLTLEASWDRVSSALAGIESADAQNHWQARFREAFADWQLLPDPRILSCAGTGRCDWPPHDLCAALNVAAFVRDPLTSWAHFDRAAFERSAGLAVRMLDNAIELVGGSLSPVSLRIGLIGLADALALLGLPYDAASGLALVREIGLLLARGSLAASVELARERGQRVRVDEARQAAARARGLPEPLISLARLHGLRHAGLTAIEPMPRLALLANNVSDALDPLPCMPGWQTIDAPGEARRLRSPGFAHHLRLRESANGSGPRSGFDAAGTDPAAQIALRGELAPWIDAPIDYPLPVAALPDAASIMRWVALAARHGLPAPRWRVLADSATSPASP